MKLNDDFVIQLLMKYSKIMVLKLFVSSQDENGQFKKLYEESIKKHNLSIINNNFHDAGFDLFSPKHTLCNTKQIKLDLNIKLSAEIITDTWKKHNTGYYLYPRSSIVKTPLRLANNVGIIDSGYRNNIMAVFDNSDLEYNIEKYTRLLQICGPNLCPIYVVLVDDENELGEKTIRGEGGFGSTGFGIENFNSNEH